MSELTEHRSCGRHCVVETSEMQFFATISQQDFQPYKSYLSDLHDWPTYEDFVLERDGSFLGLSWAGVNAVQVEAGPFRLFERWAQLTGAPRNLETLDDFVMRRWLRANFPDWSVRASPPSTSSSAGELNGFLDIPLYPETAGASHEVERLPDAESKRALLERIARECLE